MLIENIEEAFATLGRAPLLAPQEPRSRATVLWLRGWMLPCWQPDSSHLQCQDQNPGNQEEDGGDEEEDNIEDDYDYDDGGEVRPRVHTRARLWGSAVLALARTGRSSLISWIEFTEPGRLVLPGNPSSRRQFLSRIVACR